MTRSRASSPAPAVHDSASALWKPANKVKGLKDHVHAVAFIKEFPIGTTLSGDQLDDWFERQGLLTVPHNVAKSSIAWRAHLHDRHTARSHINRGASHPRMMDENLPPFSIESIGQGVFEVRSTHAAAIYADIPRRVHSVTETKKKKLMYLMQSVDWSRIPADDRLRCETIYDNIEGLSKIIGFNCEQIENNIARLELRLRRLRETDRLNLPSLTNGDDERAEAHPSADSENGDDDDNSHA
jgi:hypothetical protein